MCRSGRVSQGQRGAADFRHAPCQNRSTCKDVVYFRTYIRNSQEKRTKWALREKHQATAEATAVSLHKRPRASPSMAADDEDREGRLVKHKRKQGSPPQQPAATGSDLEGVGEGSSRVCGFAQLCGVPLPLPLALGPGSRARS